MNNIENILYSLIPLILIILFSWLFSFLGSKMKKPGENSEAAAGSNLGDRLLEMMKEAPGEAPAEAGTKQRFPAGPRVELPQQTGGPITTAKPITPKWWGA
ncbi:MAG: hypothetical protein HY912_01870 [Desulfomonile tiedjei]|uniref:Uncharacterized protein n=1 Tax=Desulfomonile tiedjei TaxID=2358 RepID=A0A9D6Z232_9BACT|nr:hypothetical protein [Desulfomonile tiedjei]